MYEVEKTPVFEKWFNALKDIRAKSRIRVRIERAAIGNFGDWAPEGGEVRSLRIDYGPGYRIYYTIRNNEIVLLLCGGVKNRQEDDIKNAHKIAEEI